MFRSRKKHSFILAFVVIIVILVFGFFRAITMSNKPQISLNLSNSYQIAGNVKIKWPYSTVSATIN
jgi:hypothetical protein